MEKENVKVVFRYDDSGLTEGERIELNLLKCMEYSFTHGKLPKKSAKRLKQLESMVRIRREYDEKNYGKHVDAVDSLPF